MECPTPSAHRRLEDAHRSWHSALDEYQDPDGFRHHLNNCIQALRNTTFVLQSERNLIAEFDEWYEPWQSEMKADSILKWLNSARVIVVHKGDLEAKSTGRVRLVIGYDDVADETMQALPADGAENESVAAEVAFRPAASFEEALESLATARVPETILKDSYVVIERRWVADSLPDHELLDALAHCHGFLLGLIADAHKRSNSEHGVTIHHEKSGELEAMPFRRLPCMVTSRVFRTTRFAMHDGRLDLGGRSWSLDQHKVTDEEVRHAAKAYKARPVKLDKFPMTPVDWLPYYVEQGRAILLSGQDHGWFVFFFRGRSVVDMRRIAARDAIDKRLLSQEIAEHVAVNDIDGLVDVSEVWTAPFSVDVDGVPVTATENPNRGESLCFYAVDAYGHEASIHIPFERRRFRKRPILGEPEPFGGENMFYLPTREVWRRKTRRQRKEDSHPHSEPL
jgi:hypothetical protein